MILVFNNSKGCKNPNFILFLVYVAETNQKKSRNKRDKLKDITYD